MVEHLCLLPNGKLNSLIEFNFEVSKNGDYPRLTIKMIVSDVLETVKKEYCLTSTNGYYDLYGKQVITKRMDSYIDYANSVMDNMIRTHEQRLKEQNAEIAELKKLINELTIKFNADSKTTDKETTTTIYLGPQPSV
jgi:hypothetical protein